MDWYHQNVTGRVSDYINQMYANGIDPLRSQEGRSMVAQLVRSIPIGNIAKLRQSAAAATEYLKNKGALERAGKYDRDLNERFLGYNLDDFDTINGGQTWNITSPLEAQSLKALTESSFNNRTAHDLTKADVESFGMPYDSRARYSGFTKKDLLDIADKIAPGLYGSPYMDYYRDLAKRKLIANGIDPTDSNVNKQLAFDIADSQDEYLIKPTADFSDWYKRQSLAMEHARLNLARQKAGGGIDAPGNDGISIAHRWYAKAASNAWGANGITKNWFDMSPDKFLQFAVEAKKVFHNFGKENAKLTTDKEIKKFQKQFSIPMDEETVASIIGSPVDGNKKVAKATDAAISKLYGVDDIITNTAGFGKPRRGADKTEEIRKAIREAGAANVTITPMGDGYGSLRKKGARFSVMPRVRVTVGDKKFDAYYNINLESAGTHGGAYVAAQNDGIYNVLPDYNGWTGYGVWDTRETHSQLAGKADEPLSTY